ncbi:MAG: nickel-type superoxide dismutase maturation protease [Frankiaceae bacterium]
MPARPELQRPPGGWAGGWADSSLPFPPSWDPTHVPPIPTLTRRRRGKRGRDSEEWGSQHSASQHSASQHGPRRGPGVVRVAGSSMLPALGAGNACLVWWSPRTRPRVGRVVVARLPGRPAVLAVKRVTGRWDGGWWLEGDNPAASTDSWQVGAVSDQDVVARVLMRYWPRPALLGARRRSSPDGLRHAKSPLDNSSAR